jgi:hypothetical protein
MHWTSCRGAAKDRHDTRIVRPFNGAQRGAPLKGSSIEAVPNWSPLLGSMP